MAHRVDQGACGYGVCGYDRFLVGPLFQEGSQTFFGNSLMGEKNTISDMLIVGT